jgi:hypothetical protein
MDEVDKENSEDRRPTPVRMAMEGTENEPEEEAPDFRTFTDPQDDREWVVRILGRSGSGILPLRVIPLMELAFARPEEPEKPVRSVLCQGEALADLKDGDLIRLLGRSKVFEAPDLDRHSQDRRGHRDRSRSRSTG